MKLLIPLMLLLSASILAQSRVVGDKSQKVYWAFGCVEARLVPFKDYVEFTNKTVAEQDGYKKADKCSTTAITVDYDTSPQTMLTKDLKKKSVSLSVISSDIDKYAGRTVRIIGGLSISNNFEGLYEERGYYSFSFYASTGGQGYFYIRKNIASEKIRKDTISLDNPIADCQVRIEGVNIIKTPYGQLLSCKFWYPETDN